ncbi:hexokinase [Nematocida homosporus]|uniref:hexokinase n=1 Tax=Nematocida homosporus TaxID=1912981 RepID=UPI00221FFBD2|nr:hexokinase [Nematocida homosporus]KAI5186758.1 hexokinase [Nematocida homosporus]
MGLLCSCHRESSTIDRKRSSRQKSINLARSFNQHLDQQINQSSSPLLKSYLLISPAQTSNIDKKVLCVDVGGTSLKMAILAIKTDGKIEMEKQTFQTYTIPHNDSQRVAQSTIYQWIAEKIQEFVNSIPSNQSLPTEGALTFSYPLEYQNGKFYLVEYTKNFRWKKPKTGSGQKEVPLDELNSALKEQASQLNINFQAIVNDAMATLLAAKNRDPMAVLGVVLGTGTNGAYFENPHGISLRHSSANPGRNGNQRRYLCALNTEWGSYSEQIVTTYQDQHDCQLDRETDSQGRYLLEKMIGGLYIEQYVQCRFQAEATSLFAKHGISSTLSESTLATIKITNEAMENPEKINGQIKECCKNLPANQRDSVVSELNSTLNLIILEAQERKQSILSGLIAAMVYRSYQVDPGRTKFTVGVNGSGIQHQVFRDMVTSEVKAILKGMINSPVADKLTIVLNYDEHASLIGAAYALITRVGLE